MSTSTEKTSMLDYCKIVLKKISFNRRLFRKEYRKTFAYLDAVDHHTLKEWLQRKVSKAEE